MTKIIFTIPLILGVSIILSACEKIEAPQPIPVVYESSSDNSMDLIIAEGEVVPAKDMQILSLSNATVEEILVEEGKLVEAGEVILRFEIPEQLSAELKAAELELLKASQALDNLNRYGNLYKQKAYQRVLEAQTSHRSALAAWDEFDQDQYDEDVEAIKEDVIDAENNLDTAKEELKEFLDLEEENTLRKNRQDDVDQAQLSLNALEREQEQLEQEYEQLELNLELTNAELDSAWEEYRKFQNNDVPEDQLKLAEQQLATSNAKVAAIQAGFEDLSVTAPFDGTLVRIDIVEGQSIHTGQVLAVIADFSTWYVESTDITEFDIVDFEVDETVTLEFDALPGESILGKVIEINDFPEIRFNDVIYRIRIELPEHDLPLRWKMSVLIKKQK